MRKKKDAGVGPLGLIGSELCMARPEMVDELALSIQIFSAEKTQAKEARPIERLLALKRAYEFSLETYRRSKKEKTSDAILKAREYVKRAHKGQTRKGSDTPYVAHLFDVEEILSRHTSDEEILVAGLLHDVVEDCGMEKAKDIKRLFGEKVLEIVLEVSEDKRDGEDKRATWKVRKLEYIKRLKLASEGALMVSAADKISNLKDIQRDLGILGEQTWKKFNGNTRQKQRWYYTQTSKAIGKRLKNPIAKELQRELDKTFAERGV